jgi:transcriptional regulator with XRE-family HTH domain
MEIGKFIRETRRSAGLTCKEIANVSGVSLRYIRDIESGRGNPSVKTLRKVLGSIGYDIKLEVKSATSISE